MLDTWVQSRWTRGQMEAGRLHGEQAPMGRGQGGGTRGLGQHPGLSPCCPSHVGLHTQPFLPQQRDGHASCPTFGGCKETQGFQDPQCHSLQLSVSGWQPFSPGSDREQTFLSFPQ